MTLVERLRAGFDWDESSNNESAVFQYQDITDEAADRIEELEAKLAACEYKDKQLETALRDYRRKVLLDAADKIRIEDDATGLIELKVKEWIRRIAEE